MGSRSGGERHASQRRAKGSLTSVQVSHVHCEAIGSGRTSWVIGELEVEDRGLSADLTFLGVWAEGSETVRGCDSDLAEEVRRLGPAPATLVVPTT